MDSKAKAKRRMWADVLVLVGAVISLLFSVWSPQAGDPNNAMSEVVDKGIWFGAQVLGGVLPIAGYLIAQKYALIGKLLVGIGIVCLLAGLGGFTEFGWIAVRSIVIPAVLMAVGLPFFGRMPTPEETDHVGISRNDR